MVLKMMRRKLRMTVLAIALGIATLLLVVDRLEWKTGRTFEFSERYYELLEKSTKEGLSAAEEREFRKEKRRSIDRMREAVERN